VVHESQAGGLLRGEPARVLAELLDFGELTAGEVMVPRVRGAGIPLGATADDVHRILAAHPHTRYPVYDGTIDRIVGMIHVKDMLRCIPAMTGLRMEQIRPLPYLPATVRVDDVITSMRQARAQMAVVLDEHGGTDGVLTSEDLFEEVVGDVGDDATGTPEVRRNADGSVAAAGVTRLETLGDALDVVIERDDVDTVSGLVLALLGHPPIVGDVVRVDGVRIEVTAVVGLGVGGIRATTVDGQPADGANQ